MRTAQPPAATTVHPSRQGKLSRGLRIANLMIVHRLSGLHTVGSAGSGSIRVRLMSMFHLRASAEGYERGIPARARHVVGEVFADS